MNKENLYTDISFEEQLDPNQLPQKFLELDLPAIFFQRPTPEMIIHIAPERRRDRLTFVEDESTGLFYCLACYIPKTITQHGACLETATYKIKGGGYGIWPLEEHAEPGYLSAKMVAETHAGEWIRVHCDGENGCKIEKIDEPENQDWENFELQSENILAAPKTGKVIIRNCAFILSTITDEIHPVLQPIIKMNEKKRQEKKERKESK